MFGQNFFCQKNFGWKIFGKKDCVQKDLGQCNFESKKSLGPENVGRKPFGSNILSIENFGQKNVCFQKNCDSKYFECRKMMVQNNSGQKNIWIEICHYNKTRTNVVGTNVAWPNVPKTVAK